MEALSLKTPGKKVWLFLVACLSGGCVMTAPWHHVAKDVAPVGPVHQVHTTWDNKINVTVDAVNSGRPLPGLVGRLYLFGPETGFPLKGDGSVVVDMYDVSAAGRGSQPVWLHRWEIDKDTLQRLFKKDTIGWGYTLFLEWGKYRPDINQVKLVACYLSEKGNPIYAPHATVTLGPPGAGPAVTQKTVVPAAEQLSKK
jgi:hypothetical protein